MRRRKSGQYLVIAIFLLAFLGVSMRSSAQAGDPYALIDAVNGLRAANGLPAYQIDNTLMSIAQAHTDYQASIGQVTHTGAGGTNPKARAAAAGYGGGGTFFMSENVCGGVDFSVEHAITCWSQDDLHLQTMLGANYRDVGAGVAVSDGFVYYTLDVAYVASGRNVGPTSTSRPGGPTSTPGGPTSIPIYAVQTSTPNPDGSVVHTVMSGQTLIGIAKSYGLTVTELMDLNNLTSDKIYVGDKLLIRRANTPGPTGTVTATTTPTRAATSTRNPTPTPTRSPSPVITASGTPIADQAQKDAPASEVDPLGRVLVVAIIGLAAGGVILMVVGSLIKRSSRG